MKDPKPEHFNQLPQCVKNLLAIQVATLMPQEELRSRLAKVSELSKKMVPGRLTLAVEKCIAKQKALVSRKKRRRLQEGRLLSQTHNNLRRSRAAQ
jgi:hypothetical protein